MPRRAKKEAAALPREEPTDQVALVVTADRQRAESCEHCGTADWLIDADGHRCSGCGRRS